MKVLIRWIPTLLIMLVIFIVSSIPSQEMPKLGCLDYLIKKGGHMLGFGLLAISYWYGMKWEKQNFWLSFFLAVIYALLDEFHQVFIPGRNASLVDVIVFDSTGAMVALGAARVIKRQKQ